MSDCNCNNDQCGEKFCEVRMYEYYILSVEPCNERVVFGPTSILVTSNMTGEAFTTYAIAMYCSDEKNKISKEDAKYLRVCYRINCTLPKERQDCTTYDRDQAKALSDIRDILQKRWGGETSTDTATGTPGAAHEHGPAGTPGRPGRGSAASPPAGA